MCKSFPANISYQAKQTLEGIVESKAKKARIGVELGSTSADARRNRLGKEDGEDGGFNESCSTPNSIACEPNIGVGNINTFFHPHTTPRSQTTLESTRSRKNVTEQANKAIINFCYSSQLAFHTSRNPYWQPIVDVIVVVGLGFQTPSYESLRVGIHKDAVRDVEDVKEHRLQWAITGCNIMSDGGTYRRNQTLINFLASCEICTIFFKFVDASNIMKFIAGLFEM
ncbi:hypothetical protein SUGI_1119560 [Cryptomeria japonica]|nr:hypothetical protein SUGI_1119560 [Cryptomeria japonica]